uniref:Glycosyltransferase family 92 protein n=1 Tax=Scylla olivacea TaxID=85551 RepID=A0A0P4WAF5_SCYOL
MFAQENVHFTDCVLRHMHQYRFLAHFDPDEVPILPLHDNFTHFLDDLIASTRHSPPVGFKLRRYYFYDNLQPSEEASRLPSYLWILRHTKRLARHLTRLHTGEVKPIHDTDVIRGVFSHASILCVSGRCHTSSMHQVPTETAFYGHFRLTCDEECLQNTQHDLTLQRHREQVSARVARVLKTLQLL